MPKRTVRNESTTDRVLHLAGVPLITAAFVFAGFYYLTNYRLSEGEQAVKVIEAKQTVQATQDRTDREKLRDKFLESQTKTIEVLGKLDARLAVAETKQDSTNLVLNKISDQLQRFNAPTKGQ